MGQHLTAMKISTVSTVDKGANEREIALLKRAGAAPPVRKAQSFAQLMAGQEAAQWLQPALDALAEVVWAAMYPGSETPQPTAEQRLLAVANSVDEFKAALIMQLGAAIAAQPATVGKRAKSLWAGFV